MRHGRLIGADSTACIHAEAPRTLPGPAIGVVAALKEAAIALDGARSGMRTDAFAVKAWAANSIETAHERMPPALNHEIASSFPACHSVPVACHDRPHRRRSEGGRLVADPADLARQAIKVHAA